MVNAVEVRFKLDQKEVAIIKKEIEGLKKRNINGNDIYKYLKLKGFYLHNIRAALNNSGFALIGKLGKVPIVTKRVNSIPRNRLNLFEKLRKMRLSILRK